MAKVKPVNARELDEMRAACQLAARTLLMVGEQLRPGMTTEDVNTLVHDYTIARGARPAPLNYRGFPKSVCTSVNEVICHGIPGPLVLRDGDILNVDVTPVLPAKGGWHGDTNATFYIGQPSADARHVVEVARESLERGIAAVAPGNTLGDIGWAIQSYAEEQGCSVVREYCGHGIGRQFHCEPSVRHYGQPGTGLRLKRGMIFTIEPMINLGGHACAHLDDGWTVLTRDGSLSAQFEHTVVVTRQGCEVLTRRDAVLRHSEDVPWARLGPLASYTG
jgi:methionyl aminopeptidase